MIAIQVRLPNHIHEQAKKLAQSERISLNRYITTSVSNEVIRQETSDFFREAAAEFNPEKFAKALSAVPARTVPNSDRIKTHRPS